MDINTVINTQPAAVEEKPSKRKSVDMTVDSESESDTERHSAQETLAARAVRLRASESPEKPKGKRAKTQSKQKLCLMGLMSALRAGPAPFTQDTNCCVLLALDHMTPGTARELMESLELRGYPVFGVARTSRCSDILTHEDLAGGALKGLKALAPIEGQARRPVLVGELWPAEWAPGAAAAAVPVLQRLAACGAVPTLTTPGAVSRSLPRVSRERLAMAEGGRARALARMIWERVAPVCRRALRAGSAEAFAPLWCVAWGVAAELEDQEGVREAISAAGGLLKQKIKTLIDLGCQEVRRAAKAYGEEDTAQYRIAAPRHEAVLQLLGGAGEWAPAGEMPIWTKENTQSFDFGGDVGRKRVAGEAEQQCLALTRVLVAGGEAGVEALREVVERHVVDVEERTGGALSRAELARKVIDGTSVPVEAGLEEESGSEDADSGSEYEDESDSESMTDDEADD